MPSSSVVQLNNNRMTRTPKYAVKGVKKEDDEWKTTIASPSSQQLSNKKKKENRSQHSNKKNNGDSDDRWSPNQTARHRPLPQGRIRRPRVGVYSQLSREQLNAKSLKGQHDFFMFHFRTSYCKDVDCLDAASCLFAHSASRLRRIPVPAVGILCFFFLQIFKQRTCTYSSIHKYHFFYKNIIYLIPGTCSCMTDG